MPMIRASRQEEVAQRTLLAAEVVGGQEDEAVEEGGARDQQGFQGLGGDPVVEGEPREAGGEGAKDEAPRQAPGVEAAVPGERRAGEEAGDEVAQVAVEVGHDGQQRPRVGGDVEGEPLVAPAQEVRDEDQVAGRADGEELGDALDRGEEDGLDGGHGWGLWKSAR